MAEGASPSPLVRAPGRAQLHAGRDHRGGAGGRGEFRPLGIGILLTHLGENLADLQQAQQVADHYHRAIDLVRARGMDAEVSLKLTQIGLDLDATVTYDHLASLTAHAAEANGTLWIDMEGSAYVDRTLELYRRVKTDHANAGICLQALPAPDPGRRA